LNDLRPIKNTEFYFNLLLNDDSLIFSVVDFWATPFDSDDTMSSTVDVDEKRVFATINKDAVRK